MGKVSPTRTISAAECFDHFQHTVFCSKDSSLSKFMKGSNSLPAVFPASCSPSKVWHFENFRRDLGNPLISYCRNTTQWIHLLEYNIGEFKKLLLAVYSGDPELSKSKSNASYCSPSQWISRKHRYIWEAKRILKGTGNCFSKKKSEISWSQPETRTAISGGIPGYGYLLCSSN